MQLKEIQYPQPSILGVLWILANFEEFIFNGVNLKNEVICIWRIKPK